MGFFPKDQKATLVIQKFKKVLNLKFLQKIIESDKIRIRKPQLILDKTNLIMALMAKMSWISILPHFQHQQITFLIKKHHLINKK